MLIKCEESAFCDDYEIRFHSDFLPSESISVYDLLSFPMRGFKFIIIFFGLCQSGY